MGHSYLKLILRIRLDLEGKSHTGTDMMLPAFTPAWSIIPAIGLLPVQEQRGVANRNRKLNLSSEVRTWVQSGITARNVKTRTGFDHQ